MKGKRGNLLVDEPQGDEDGEHAGADERGKPGDDRQERRGKLSNILLRPGHSLVEATLKVVGKLVVFAESVLF